MDSQAKPLFFFFVIILAIDIAFISKGHYFLVSSLHKLNYNQTSNNTTILTECKTLKYVVCSAADAKTDGIFYDSQTAIGI
eukprot:15085967-Ditylum_brightwellii.AAC.1